MKPAQRGFLLLSSCLGDPDRKPLTTAQMRTLADRAWQLDVSQPERQLQEQDLTALGYGKTMAQRILRLLEQEDVLEHYLLQAKRAGCVPITRVDDGYPLRLRRQLGQECPGVLWAKGDTALLREPMIALVGSRDLMPENREFAAEVGRQAAWQGYTLVSGNARGSDRTAQEACLANGGKVISVVADALAGCPDRERVLYLSEEDFDQPFSAARALSRNRVIHSMTPKTFVAQCSAGTGGTWDGTVKNLRFGWSDVFCFRDGSAAAAQLEQMGAVLIGRQELCCIEALSNEQDNFFDQ